MIGSFKLQYGTNNWTQFIPKVMYNMKTQIHSATKNTPHKIVFGVHQNTSKLLSLPEELEIDNIEIHNEIIYCNGNVNIVNNSNNTDNNNTAVTSDLIVSDFLNKNVEPTVTNEVELVNSSLDDNVNNNF